MTTLFNPPAYVYVYIDKNTDRPVYIGKVNAGNSLDTRINQHRTDVWYDEQNQEIWFTPVDNSATADMLETALIGTYKESDPDIANIAKTHWGSSDKLTKDQFGWIPYEKYNNQILRINKETINILDTQIARKEEYLSNLIDKIEKIIDILHEI